MERNTVVVITGNSYPKGDAGAVRQHAFCKLLQQIGYNPIVIGMGKTTQFQEAEYDGVRFYSLRYPNNSLFVRLWGRIAFLPNLKRVMKNILPETVAGILVVSGGNCVFKWVEAYSSKHAIPIYHDSVEWYSPEEFNWEKLDIEYRSKDLLNRKVVRRKWRVIAISKYLEDHFRKQCIDVMRVPVIMDVSELPYRISADCNTSRIRFAYVGAPAKKDFLAELIHGFSMLEQPCLDRIELHIVGVNREKLISMCGAAEADIAKLGKKLVIHGRLPRNEALQWVADADYTLLLRNETLRYAKAGFPTKIVESLSFGTPPVCNLSSDLSEYLKDEVNSFVIPGHAAEDVRDTIVRVIERHPLLGSELRRNARKTAEECFDISVYASMFEEFFAGDR